jgi:O-antigen/teichoic acid export membrane protein
VALVTQTFAAVLQGVQRGDRENLAWTAGLGTYVVVLVSGLLAGLTWQALLLASAASTLVGMTVILRSIATILPEVRVRWGPVSLGETRVLLTASGILVVTQLSDVIDTQVDKLLLVRYTAPAHAAWYDVGASVVGGLRSFALIGLVVLLPGLAELFVRRPDGAVRLYERVAALTIPWAFVILGGGAVLGPPFVHLWLGSSYSAAGTVIRMLSIAMLIQAVAAPGAMLAVAIGHARRAAVAAGVNIAVNASVSLVLVQHIGLQGALIGSIAGNACATALFLLLLRPVAPSLCFAGLRPGTLLLGTTAVAVGCWIVQGHSWQAFVLGGVGWAVVSASLLLRGEAAPRNLLAQLRERGSSTADA